MKKLTVTLKNCWIRIGEIIMIENQTDKYQDAYQKALSNIQDPTDVQKKALEYGE